MPAAFLDRLPLPSLRAYTAVSVALVSVCLYYALVQVTSQQPNEWIILSNDSNDTNNNNNVSGIAALSDLPAAFDNAFFVRAVQVVYFVLQEPLCVWTFINMAYCCLILFGKLIQKIVFGELRVAEQQHIKDKFWNFVFYKFIFIFGVMNVQFMDEVVLWCGWFSVLGFLHLLAQLCKDRFEYLSFSPTTPKWTHIRVVSLLLGILFLSFGLFGVCILVGLHAGLTTFSFMAAECALVTVKTSYVIVRYAIHLWDISHEGVWENRASYVYYSELLFELAGLSIDFLHHLHMLLWGNIFLSMASLVICMQLRYLFYEIRRRIQKHKNYLRVVRHMEANYPMATPEEIEKNSDDCAICWDRIEGARKLPCGHLFHNSCLRSWLEQDTSCPTCRMTLANHMNSDLSGSVADDNRNNLMDDRQGQMAMNQMTNHFFHFDGSRYVSWLPSFSVEVTHTNLLGERETHIQTSQLDSMARQVHQMFPHIPLGLIRDDLRVTRSVDMTVENILDERLVPPPSAMFSQVPAARSQSSSVHDTTSMPLPLVPGDGSDSPPGFSLDDSDPEDGSSDCPRPDGHGSRFSKSSEERERMLARRKDELLKMARKRYLSRLQRSDQDNKSSALQCEDDTQSSR